MSESRIVLTDNTEFLPQEDRRAANIRLAFRMFIRELRGLKLESADKLLKRWSIEEIEEGDTVRLGISFPEDVTRYQWFRTEGFELRKVQGIKDAKTKKA